MQNFFSIATRPVPNTIEHIFLLSMISSIIDSLLRTYGTMGYIDIFFLMALESSIVPVPSELVMIPAGYFAHIWSLNPLLAVLAGWLWSILGATVNYFILGRYIGRPFLEKYGKYILITREKYQMTESLFLKNQYLYTFFGRLMPVVRHLISIPAGIFRMPILPFWGITFLGSLIWSGILVALGWFFGESVIEIARHYSHIIGIVVIPLIAVFLWWKIWWGKKNKL